jgi:transposase
MVKLMNKQQRDCIASRIVQFYTKNGNNFSKTCQHFTVENISKSTIVRTLNRYKTTGIATTSSSPGRTIKKINLKSIAKIKKLLNGNPNISNKKASAKLKIPKTTYLRLVKKRLGYKTFKKETVPKYIKNQESRVKNNSGVLAKKLRGNVVLIMDDETYVMADSSQTKLQRYYKAKAKEDVSDQYRFQPKQKYPKKFMVWQALDDNGNATDPFIFEGTMNSELYVKECLKKRLVPFIQIHHPNSKILFWPDMATSHYAENVTSFLEENKIDYIKKKDNLPNCPQARPIEKFWAICKQKYAETGKQYKTLRNFKIAWNKISNEVINESGKALMMNTKQKLKLINKYGPLQTFKQQK